MTGTDALDRPPWALWHRSVRSEAGPQEDSDEEKDRQEASVCGRHLRWARHGERLTQPGVSFAVLGAAAADYGFAPARHR